MANPKVNRNCILTIASRIANEQPVSESQAVDLCNALAEHFSEQGGDEGGTFRLVVKATKRVVDEQGLPPGYLHKYEPGVEDGRRKENVREAYETARKQYNIHSKLDALWE